MSDSRRYRRRSRLVFSPLFKNIANYYTPAAEDVLLLWYIIVEAYTKRKLTYNSDKLAALISLERYLTKISCVHEYAFGTWKTDLPRGLLWRSTIVGSLRHVAHRAPSWSWASRDGQISYSLGTVSEILWRQILIYRSTTRAPPKL